VTILAFGGEMGFFIPSDANAIETTAANFNSSFARCSAKATGSTSYFDTPTVSGQTSFWVHFDYKQEDPLTSDSTARRFIELLDSGGIARLRLTETVTGNIWGLDKWTGTAWTSIGTFSAELETLQTVDIHVVCNTSSGTADVYLSGTKRIAGGTVNLSGFTSFTKMRCWGHTSGIGADNYYSQIVIATESTIGMKVGTVYMSGQGTTHTFDTGGYTNVDETVYSDADFVQSGTAGQIELFTGTSIPSFTGYSIRALALTARAKSDGSAPAHFRFQLRSAGTTYDNGSDLALDFGYGNYCAVWETNPATSAAFQPSEISALQYGVKSVT